MPRVILEEGENYRIYDDGTILVRNVRFSYPHLDKPWAKNPEKETPKYGIVGMMPKKTHKAAIVRVRKYADDLIDAQKGENSKIFKKDMKFIRDGNDSGKEQYLEHWTINASETKRPSVRGKDTKPIPQDQIAEAIPPGYYGDILIRPWWMNNEHGKRVNAGLSAVQVKRGRPEDRIGEGGVSEEDIDETFDASDEIDDDDGGYEDDDDL